MVATTQARRVLFWLMVSERSVHGHWFQAIMVKVMMDKIVHFKAAGQQSTEIYNEEAKD